MQKSASWMFDWVLKFVLRYFRKRKNPNVSPNTNRSLWAMKWYRVFLFFFIRTNLLLILKKKDTFFRQINVHQIPILFFLRTTYILSCKVEIIIYLVPSPVHHQPMVSIHILKIWILFFAKLSEVLKSTFLESDKREIKNHNINTFT